MKRLLAALLLLAAPASAQNAGTVTNHAFAIGKGQGVTGYTSLLCASGQIAVGQATDPICRTVSGDWTLNAAGVSTLATVNANVGTFGSATQCITTTQNAKGLTTAISAATCTPAVGSITGLGTGVATALANNIGTTGAPVLYNGDAGTPLTLTLINARGLPIVGITGLGTGVATALALPVTGSQGIVLAQSPTITSLTMAGTATALGLVDASSAGAGQFKFPAVQNPSADPNTLDDYKEGTFTPSVSFGGNSAGVTYSLQVGKYTKIGSIVHYVINLILTSKGSSTGLASVNGLPIAAAASGDAAAAIQINNFTATAITTVQAQVPASTTGITLSRYAGGTNTQLADTDFTNTSVVKIGGIYFTP